MVYLSTQGTFRVKRELDGRIAIMQPPYVLVEPAVAVKMAEAILKACGVETVFASPGQTVIRPRAAL